MSPERTPYEAHLCAADPLGFEEGFSMGPTFVRTQPIAVVLAVHDAIRDSDGKPWAQTSWSIAFPPTAYGEGLALAVYGLVQLASEPRHG